MAAKTYGHGWYLVKTSTGAIVLVWHNHDGQPIALGQGLEATKVVSLQSTNRNPASLASEPAITQAALKSLRATAAQFDAFGQQMDNGAPMRNPTLTEIVIDAKGAMHGFVGHKSVSTSPGSEAHYSPIIPDPFSGLHIPNPLGPIDAIVAFVTSGSNWKRIGQVLLGGVLILMGLRTLSGHTVTPATVVTAPAKAAKTVVASKVA